MTVTEFSQKYNISVGDQDSSPHIGPSYYLSLSSAAISPLYIIPPGVPLLRLSPLRMTRRFPSLTMPRHRTVLLSLSLLRCHLPPIHHTPRRATFKVIPFAHDTPLSVAYNAPTYRMVATVTHTGIEITSQLQDFTKFVQIDVLAVRSKTYIGQLCA